MDQEQRRQEIEKHLDAIRELEAPPVERAALHGWPPDGFYALWHVVVGMVIGGMGALVSLAANAAGAPLFGQRPLQLIRVYLTFPMGERALEVSQGMVLFTGCVLYLFTGALYGTGFHLVMTLYFADSSKAKRFAAATAMGLALWIVNFYLILSWLQPLLLGGNWIVAMVPPWVGAATHLTFAWTMLLGEFWGRFEPDRTATRDAA